MAGGKFAPPMVDDCEKVVRTIGKHGEFVESSTIALKCRIRSIPREDKGTNKFSANADSLIHLPYDAPVTLGDIIRFDGIDYRIERFIPATRLGNKTSNPEFLKAELTVTKTTSS